MSKDIYFTVVFKADSLSEEERSTLVEKCSAASWSHAIDERRVLDAEVDRLRETEKKLRKISHSLKDDNASYFSRNLALEQERDQLKARVIELEEYVRNGN